MKMFILLSLALISTCCLGQPDSKVSDSLYKFVYKDSIIETTRVGGINLFDNVDSIIKLYHGIIKHDDRELFYELLNEQLKPILILVKYYPSDKTISGIGIQSPYFHTKDDIHLGMRISELNKLFPEMEIKHIGEYHEYAIIPNVEIEIGLKSDNNSLLGRYPQKNAIETTKDFRLEGKIESLTIGK